MLFNFEIQYCGFELKKYPNSLDSVPVSTRSYCLKMGYICEFCGEQRSMVYCRSDAACLCLSCDRNVHSANALSRRHSRTLLCERCNSQPAVVRCAEERVSLCQNCDWIGHGASTSASTHKRQTLNCYSGCPSAAELSSIWSFVLDLPTVRDSMCEKEMGLMSIAEEGENAACIPPKDSSSQDVSACADVEAGKAKVWVGSSSLPELKSVSLNMGQPAASASTATPKVNNQFILFASTLRKESHREEHEATNEFSSKADCDCRNIVGA